MVSRCLYGREGFRIYYAGINFSSKTSKNMHLKYKIALFLLPGKRLAVIS